jgi:hypothetical protein
MVPFEAGQSAVGDYLVLNETDKGGPIVAAELSACPTSNHNEEEKPICPIPT